MRAGRRELLAADMRDFLRAAFLDRNVIAVRRLQVNRRQRRGDVERDLVLAREHGHAVGANLVGRVAIGRNAIGADNDEVHLALPHQRARHVVGDDGGVDAVAHEFPCGEPGSLQKRPRLVSEHNDCLALLDGTANDTERRAVAGRGQCAGIAVRQDARVGGHHRCAECAHGAAARDVLVMNQLRVTVEAIFDLLDRLADLRAGGKRPLHPIDRPEQIDGGRTRAGHQLADVVELRGELLRPGRLAFPDPDRDAHGRRHADGWRAANDHRLDGACHLSGRLAAHVDLLRGQLALVDHHDDIVFPGDGGQHIELILPVCVTASARQTGAAAASSTDACLPRPSDSRG